MRTKKLCLLSVGMSFLLCAAANSTGSASDSLRLNNRVKKAERAVNQETSFENEAKKDDDFDYQLGAPDDTYVSNLGDEFESENIFESADAEYKTIGEDGTMNDANHNPSPVQTLDTDPNEDNDSFDKASAVYVVGQDEGRYGNWVQWGATINQKTSGWWLWEKKYVDKDFYAFDVTVDGILDVKMTNIPSGCDYDMRLYKQENSEDNTLSKMSFDNYLDISQYGSNHDEEIVHNVTPGTYYVAVYSYQDKTWSDDPYLIRFQQTENNTSSTTRNYHIPTGRSDGDLGAVWKSSYDPVGIKPTSLSVDNAKYRFDCYKSYPYITHLYDKYNGQDKDIEYARIYIWDVNVRATIYAVAQELLNQIDAELNDKLDQTYKVNMSINGSSIVFGIGSTVLSIPKIATVVSTLVSPWVGFAVSATSTVIAIVGQIFSAYFNSDYTSKLRDFRDFLINLKAAMEVNRYSTNEEVVMMRFRYRFAKENGSYYIDFHPVYRIRDYNLAKSDYITYISDESPINGLVHGFKNASEISSYLR